MGFTKESLSTPTSEKIYVDWKKKMCQPNYWRGVSPSSTTSCGPYSPAPGVAKAADGTASTPSDSEVRDESNDERVDLNGRSHDTIAMVVIDPTGTNLGSDSLFIAVLCGVCVCVCVCAHVSLLPFQASILLRAPPPMGLLTKFLAASVTLLSLVRSRGCLPNTDERLKMCVI